MSCVLGVNTKILKQIERGELDLQSATEQLQRYFKLDYLELLDANTLKKITDNTSKIAILSAVVVVIDHTKSAQLRPHQRLSLPHQDTCLAYLA
jgi:pantothenate synthetase